MCHAQQPAAALSTVQAFQQPAAAGSSSYYSETPTADQHSAAGAAVPLDNKLSMLQHGKKLLSKLSHNSSKEASRLAGWQSGQTVKGSALRQLVHGWWHHGSSIHGSTRVAGRRATHSVPASLAMIVWSKVVWRRQQERSKDGPAVQLVSTLKYNASKLYAAGWDILCLLSNPWMLYKALEVAPSLDLGDVKLVRQLDNKLWLLLGSEVALESSPRAGVGGLHWRASSWHGLNVLW